MNRHILLIVVVSALLITAAGAHAAPSIVSDPVHSDTTHCGFKLDAAARTNIPVATSGTSKICKMDVSGVSVGTHTVDATAVAVGNPSWLESAPSVPFTFTRPGPPAVPGALTLVQIAGVPTAQSAIVPAGVTQCAWVVDGGTPTDRPVIAGPRCGMDLSALSVGSHVLTARAVINDPIWGRLESAPTANFTYLVPGTLTAPSGFSIVP